MGYRKLNSEELKETIYQILCAFAEYCDENGLLYSLSGGTLLGAVRHHDFIPWDDDIDVIMPRNDYMKLQQMVKEKPIGDHYSLIAYEDHTAEYPFAKVIDLNTRVEERCTTNDEYLWIDIFPVDGLSGDPQEDAKQLQKAHNYKVAYGRAAAVFGEGTTRLRAILKTPVLIYHKMIGKKRYAEKIHEICLKYDFDHSEYVAAAAWPYGPQERIPHSCFENREKKLFRRQEFYVMSCWEYYLRSIFGDYMKLPPENKRINHLMDAFVKTEE